MPSKVKEAEDWRKIQRTKKPILAYFGIFSLFVARSTLLSHFALFLGIPSKHWHRCSKICRKSEKEEGWRIVWYTKKRCLERCGTSFYTFSFTKDEHVRRCDDYINLLVTVLNFCAKFTCSLWFYREIHSILPNFCDVFPVSPCRKIFERNDFRISILASQGI